MTNGLYGRCLHDLNPNECDLCVFNEKVVSYLRELHPDIVSDKGFDTGTMVKVHQNQKLRELIEKRIEEINTHQKRLRYESNMATDYDMELQSTRAELQKLLEDCKK